MNYYVVETVNGSVYVDADEYQIGENQELIFLTDGVPIHTFNAAIWIHVRWLRKNEQ